MADLLVYSSCFDCKDKPCSLCELNMYRQGILRQEKWISVDERVPEIPGAYLVYTHDRRIKIDYCYDFFGNGKLYFEALVTHWMPLPAPPKMKGGE